MTYPFLSIVVPTRNRAHTLRYALASCLDQSFADYELIVMDNCSTAETRQVVEALASPRIKYFRSPAPLSMAKNWELALSYTKGEWVIFIGDDDALIADSLRQLVPYLNPSLARAIRWELPTFIWPGTDAEMPASQVRVPISGKLIRTPSKQAIQRVLNFTAPFYSLPSIYHGAIHRSLIERFRAQTIHSLFTRYPDVYSSFALTYLCDSFITLPFPCTISGHSSASNGGSMRRTLRNIPEFYLLNNQDELPYHPWIGEIAIYPVSHIAESFWHAKEAYFPEDPSLHYDRKTFLKDLLACLAQRPAAEWQTGLDVIKRTLRNEPSLSNWFSVEVTRWRGVPQPPELEGPARPGFRDGCFVLNSAQEPIRDTVMAAKWCGQFYWGAGQRNLIAKHFAAYVGWKYARAPRRLLARVIRYFYPTFRKRVT